MLVGCVSVTHGVAEVLLVEHLSVDDIPKKTSIISTPVRDDLAATRARNSGDGDVEMAVRPTLLVLAVEHHALERLALIGDEFKCARAEESRRAGVSPP
jgi:hypothetical protein